MNVCPAPAFTVVYAPGANPALAARYWVRKSVDEPWLVTPSLWPLKSAGLLIWSALPFATTSTSPGDVRELHDALDALALGLQVDRVVVEPDDTLDVAGVQ